ncbi:hypothetical protein [Maribacter aquivivus]|uniref:hypothetical protein n=1 Tax=Maribacter aquivivus TaxID=228958 RepID=UPI00249058F5|nr:hypothetical protein [Maribacter aquivivus]
MNHLKCFYFLVFVLVFQKVCSQDTLDINEVYIENDLVYKYSDNARFTGVTQMKRRKREVYFEEVYNDGIILFDYQYFKGSDRKLIYRTDYNRYKPWSKEKEFYYPKSGKWIQITSYDENGKKILVEQFEKEKLIYSCQYSGKKKNGQEICYDEHGNQLIFQYVNGKILRVKNRKKSR